MADESYLMSINLMRLKGVSLKDMKNKLHEKTKEAEDAKKEVERLNKILSGLIP